MPPHIPHIRPHRPPPIGVSHPHFHARYYGGVPAEIIRMDMERPEPELPWRVISTTSWGSNVLFQSAVLTDALKFFKSAKMPGAQLRLQRWTGNAWQTEASRNSQGQLSGVSEGANMGTFILGTIAIVALYYML